MCIPERELLLAARFTPDREVSINDRITWTQLNFTAFVFSVENSLLSYSPTSSLFINFIVGDNPANFVGFIPVKECLISLIL